MKSIRKFGVNYCDLPTMISNVSFFLRVFTINIDTRYKKRIPIIFYILTIVLISSNFYVYFFSVIWFVFCRYPETGDLVAAMVVLSQGMCSDISTLKIMYIVANIGEIRKVVEEYLECNSLLVPGSRFSKNLQNNLKNVKRRAMISWVILAGNGLSYIMMPIFKSGRHLMEDMYVLYGLEPKFETPNYEITYFCMAASVTFVCYTAANITAFIIIITGYSEAQMLALSEEIAHVWDDALEDNDKNTTDIQIGVLHAIFHGTENIIDDDARHRINAHINQRLKDIVKSHSRNINLMRNLENVYRGVIAIGFVFLILGLIAELLGGLENTYMQVPFTFLQVTMDCWIGQRVIDASVIFERSVYECKWENFNRANMKIVLLILQNSQKTMTLSAGGVAMLSFSCLMSIIRSVYSAYTTLRSTMVN